MVKKMQVKHSPYARTAIHSERIDDLIKEFYRIKNQLGKTPSILEFTKGGKFYRSSVTRPFGNWNVFLTYLGEPTVLGRKKVIYDLDVLKKQFTAFVQKNKREPLSSEFQKFAGISLTLRLNQFGHWDEFLKKLRRR